MEMGDCPEREEIMEKIMEKQPFFMKNIAPTLMTHKQAETATALPEKVIETIVNTKCEQTDDSTWLELTKNDTVTHVRDMPAQTDWLEMVDNECDAPIIDHANFGQFYRYNQ